MLRRWREMGRLDWWTAFWLVVLVVGMAMFTAGTLARAATCRLSLAVNGQARPCATATTADTFGTAWQRSYLWSGARLTGRLLTPAGAPSVGTPVSVSQVNLDGTVPTLDAQTVTDANGYYALVVSRWESRILTVTAAGESQMVVEDVAPNVLLHVTSRRHGVLVLAGRVLTGGSVPMVIFEDWVRAQPGQAGHWQTFATAALDGPAGWYRAVYDSPPGTVGQRFVIRAVTTPTAELLAGTSGKHGVRVRR